MTVMLYFYDNMPILAPLIDDLINKESVVTVSEVLSF